MKSPIQFFLTGLLFLFWLSGCSGQVRLNDLNLLTPEGEEFDLSITEGKPVFINYWATWCGPCIAEMPSIDILAKELADEEVVFLVISDQSLEKINTYLEDKTFSLHFVKQVLAQQEKELRSFPQTYLIDAEGKVLFKKVGSTDWGSPEMVKKLRSLIHLKNEEP